MWLRTIAALTSLWVLCCASQDETDPCLPENHSNISHLYERYRDNDHGCETSRTKFKDYILQRLWYNVGTRLMPTFPVSLCSCGTTFPIWMKGTVPNPMDGIVNRTACQAFVNNNCYSSLNIKMKACGTYFVYHLVPTGVSGVNYCFGLHAPVKESTILTSISTTDVSSMITGFYTTKPTKGPVTVTFDAESEQDHVLHYLWLIAPLSVLTIACVILYFSMPILLRRFRREKKSDQKPTISNIHMDKENCEINPYCTLNDKDSFGDDHTYASIIGSNVFYINGDLMNGTIKQETSPFPDNASLQGKRACNIYMELARRTEDDGYEKLNVSS